MASDADQDSGSTKEHTPLGDFVRLAVLSWSIAMLSLNYLGYVKAMDPTFPASLLTGTMASFGVAVGKPGGQKKKDDTGTKQVAPSTTK